MKVEFGESNIRISFDTDQELQNYEKWLTGARQELPKLVKLWSLEPPVLQLEELFQKMGEEDGLLGTFKRYLKTEEGNLVFIRHKRPAGNSGRPIGDRAIVAIFRLLCGAPYDLVLKKEKSWRTKEYLAKVRDKSVYREMRDAKHKAQRDADNCLYRAREAIADVLKQHPEFISPYAVLSNMAKEWWDQNQASNSPKGLRRLGRISRKTPQSAVKPKLNNFSN